MQIINMRELTMEQLLEAAHILTTSLPLGWPTVEEAMAEINERLIPDNNLLAAVEDDQILGWGGILAPEYEGNVFELHPLAVEQSQRNRGIGRALVNALENEARKQGGLTIWLGADDVKNGGETSFSNTNLYENFPEKMEHFTPGSHQSGFYLKLGYKIIGVLPDANGTGKPDIFFGKSLLSK